MAFQVTAMAQEETRLAKHEAAELRRQIAMDSAAAAAQATKSFLHEEADRARMHTSSDRLHSQHKQLLAKAAPVHVPRQLHPGLTVTQQCQRLPRQHAFQQEHQYEQPARRNEEEEEALHQMRMLSQGARYVQPGHREEKRQPQPQPQALQQDCQGVQPGHREEKQEEWQWQQQQHMLQQNREDGLKHAHPQQQQQQYTLQQHHQQQQQYTLQQHHQQQQHQMLQGQHTQHHHYQHHKHQLAFQDQQQQQRAQQSLQQIAGSAQQALQVPQLSQQPQESQHLHQPSHRSQEASLQLEQPQQPPHVQQPSPQLQQPPYVQQPQYVQQPSPQLQQPPYVQQPSPQLQQPQYVQQPSPQLQQPQYVQQPSPQLQQPPHVQQPSLELQQPSPQGQTVHLQSPLSYLSENHGVHQQWGTGQEQGLPLPQPGASTSCHPEQIGPQRVQSEPTHAVLTGAQQPSCKVSQTEGSELLLLPEQLSLQHNPPPASSAPVPPAVQPQQPIQDTQHGVPGGTRPEHTCTPQAAPPPLQLQQHVPVRTPPCEDPPMQETASPGQHVASQPAPYQKRAQQQHAHFQRVQATGQTSRGIHHPHHEHRRHPKDHHEILKQLDDKEAQGASISGSHVGSGVAAHAMEGGFEEPAGSNVQPDPTRMDAGLSLIFYEEDSARDDAKGLSVERQNLLCRFGALQDRVAAQIQHMVTLWEPQESSSQGDAGWNQDSMMVHPDFAMVVAADVAAIRKAAEATMREEGEKDEAEALSRVVVVEALRKQLYSIRTALEASFEDGRKVVTESSSNNGSARSVGEATSTAHITGQPIGDHKSWLTAPHRRSTPRTPTLKPKHLRAEAGTVLAGDAHEALSEDGMVQALRAQLRAIEMALLDRDLATLPNSSEEAVQTYLESPSQPSDILI
ncbi:hypothetical protein CYMTET_33907 [Cymbomonas tetramitiformis]|uniref:Uncharacterized protein n=1 Tax=Cymbomonas tetramitiformis TaxID=36881 RepID=A0AAE0FC67_9CHLO|nr:hypothetical protein CYMTET_33907 [Cymbomonas tetramitiformis]